MIRLLHFADLHLGVENYGRLDPATGLSSRLGDFLRALDAIVDYALEGDIHLVVFAGDVYRGHTPSPTHQREFAKRILRLTQAEIPVFLLPGNHDIPSTASRATTVEIFQTLGVENVWVAPLPGTYRIETRGGILQIVALPWVSRSRLLSKEEYKDTSLQEVDALITQKVESILEAEIGGLDPRLPSLLVAHGSLFGAVYSSERSVMLGQEVVLPRSAVINPAFDYVALGHIHKHQVLSEAPPVAYSGSVERVDFGEEGEDKGFIVAGLERPSGSCKEGKTNWEFIPLEARPFLTIEVEAEGSNPMPQLLQTLSRYEVEGAVVRVRIHATAEAASLIDERAILKSLQGASYVAAISKDVERVARLRLGRKWVEEISPQEVLERYLSARKVPPERTELLLTYARRILEGEG